MTMEARVVVSIDVIMSRPYCEPKMSEKENVFSL